MDRRKEPTRMSESSALSGMINKFLAQAAIRTVDLLQLIAPDAYSALRAHVAPKNDFVKPEANPRVAYGEKRSQPTPSARAPRKAPEREKVQGSRQASKEGTTARDVKPANGNTLLTPKEFAPLSTVKSDQTIRNWINKGRLIGWKEGKRGYVLPADQLNSQRQPIAGLSEVAQTFGDPKQAWQWLNQPNPELDDKTPLELLRQRKTNVKRVQVAAQAAVGVEANG